MADMPVTSSAMGAIPGRFHGQLLVCQYVHLTSSQGRIWNGGDPFAYSVPIFMAQFILIFFFSRTTYFFLRPLKQSMINAQLIAGIVMRLVFLVDNKKIATKLFPPGGRMILETIADVGFFLHFFILGVQIDTSLFVKAGKNALLIGTTASLVPLLLGSMAVYSIPNLKHLDHSLEKSLPFLVVITSFSSFPVISSLLSDLKILNSELGHLSVTASLVNNFWCYVVVLLVDAIHVSVGGTQSRPLLNVVWLGSFVIFIFFALRPVILQIGKRIPEGRSMNECQFLSIVILVLVSGFISESMGQPAGLGTFILGMSIPEGPPLGSALVDKLGTLSGGILLPAKIVIGGMCVDLMSIGHGNAWMIVAFLLLLGYIGKFSGTFVTAISCGFPFWNSVSLSLIMSCKGIIEIGAYMLALSDGVIDVQVYSILMISMLIATGIARPLIWYLYDPSQRYSSHPRNCILDSLPNSELRMVVCIHSEENVPPMISLLEVSNPTKHRPLVVSVLNLVRLTGRGSAVLKQNQPKKKLTSFPSRSGQIINVFTFFEKCSQGHAKVQHFTAISPYVSMHSDICSVALDQRAAVIIVPFHKKWAIDGSVGATFPSIRLVNQQVIKNAPCSVGILVDRGQLTPMRSALNCKLSFKITLLFIGGDDDREALAYCSRMVEHPSVTLTLIWLRPSDDDNYCNFVNKAEINLYRELIDQFRANSLGKDRIIYKEEMVKDAVETTRVLRSMENCCDLFVVGRYHDPESPLTIGLDGWGDCPELGVLGDVLATSDFQFSVLVMQQQPPFEEYYNDKSFNGSQDSYEVMKIGVV